MKNYKIIALQNYGPSGSTLMHSLLDNHTKIISLPWLYALPLYFIWDNKILNGKITLNILKDVINKDLKVLFDPSLENGDPSLSRMGNNEDEIIRVDKKTFFNHFEDYFNSVETFERRDFIISIYSSFNKSYGKHFDENSYISFPIHDQPRKHAKYLIEDFKDVKFLHIVRNPTQTIGSIIKHINFNQQKFSLFKSILMCAISNIVLEERLHWEEGFVKLYGKTPYFEDSNFVQTRYIKLEDIHLKNELVMNKICKWLSISFEKSLTESTFMGLLWHNRAESVKSSGIGGKSISQKHQQYLSKFDKYRIKLICKNEHTYFKYDSYSGLDIFTLYFLLPIIILLPFKCDFIRRRQVFRFKAMLKEFSNDKHPIFEWIIFDSVKNTLAGSELIKITKNYNNQNIALISLLTSIPIYLFRLIFNYFSFRRMIIRIWYKIVFKKNENISILPLE